MIGAFWGVFIWKEFKGAPKGTNGLLVAMFLFYLIGLAVLILSKLNCGTKGLQSTIHFQL